MNSDNLHKTEFSPSVKLNWFTRLFFHHVWKETGREFLRKERREYYSGKSDSRYFNVYAVYEQCVRSGEKRIREVWETDWRA